MRLSEGVEWGLHCCSLLALLPPPASLPAARLAEFHDVAPAYLAKHLQVLARAGIVRSEPGPKGGYRLNRPPAEISVLEVVLAVDGDGAAFRCTEIRRRGPTAQPASAYPRPCGIARVMAGAEAAWRAELARHSIADLVAGVAADASPVAIRKGMAWFQEVLR